jgi:hypothetical protein
MFPAQLRRPHPGIVLLQYPRWICSSLKRRFFMLRPPVQFTRELQYHLVEQLNLAMLHL